MNFSLTGTRTRMVVSTATILVALIATIVGLTLGLHVKLPPNGGSPPERSLPEELHLNGQERIVRNKPYPSGASRIQYDEYITQQKIDSQYRTYSSAAVTSETNGCSQIGSDILSSGQGSAVDASIATFLCACIINAHSCGIGGGHFATIYEAPTGTQLKSVTTVIARERAPAAASRDMFVNNTAASSVGGLAVAVPGEISGFYTAWKKYGRMPWKDLFTESIRLCEEGFLVENALAGAIRQYNASIRADPNLGEIFLKEDGSLVQTGDLLVNPKLGTTMRRIADDPMTFYTGSLAVDIVADLFEYGSIITLADMEAYRSEFKDPLTITLDNGDYKVYAPTAPSSGAVLSFILNILDGYNFGPSDLSTVEQKTLAYHRITEAFKFAFAKRSELGDEDFVDITELIANLTSPAYAESIRDQIDDQWTHDVDYYGPTFDFVPDSGTAHINIHSQDGAAVAMTGTVNLYFGAKVRGRRTGIIFNDEMDDFSTPGTKNAFGVPASPSNYIVPGKIPMSSMNPIIVQDASGNVVLLSGGAGGTTITTQTSFVAMNSLWFGLDLKESSDTARIHHQLVPNELDYENWLEPSILNGLRAKNHTTDPSTSISVVSTIRNSCLGLPGTVPNPDECIEAVSDGRKGGVPAGY